MILVLNMRVTRQFVVACLIQTFYKNPIKSICAVALFFQNLTSAWPFIYISTFSMTNFAKKNPLVHSDKSPSLMIHRTSSRVGRGCGIIRSPRHLTTRCYCRVPMLPSSIPDQFNEQPDLPKMMFLLR